MKTKRIGNATLYLGTMEETICNVQADHILTDPPYLYIKTHNFDKEFDEQLLFEQAKRMLPDNGFIALFGRGTSFYRWNTRLADLGFVFKEEIVWDKRYTTAPCMALSRVHETISIHTKKSGKIKRSKVPYVEQKQHDITSIINDIKRINCAIKSETTLNNLILYLQGYKHYEFGKTGGCGIAVKKDMPQEAREVRTLRMINEGMREKTIIDTGWSKHGVTISKSFRGNPREVNTLNSILKGMNEKSILTSLPERNKYKHPTEKPVRLAERILALISNEGDTIYDPFMGSGSFGVACINTGRKYIGSEMKKEYFDIACKRIAEAVKAKQEELFKEAV